MTKRSAFVSKHAAHVAVSVPDVTEEDAEQCFADLRAHGLVVMQAQERHRGRWQITMHRMEQGDGAFTCTLDVRCRFAAASMDPTTAETAHAQLTARLQAHGVGGSTTSITDVPDAAAHRPNKGR